MYVINPSVINKDKLYIASGVEANWLIYEKKIPLFAHGEKGEFLFMKTEELTKALDEMPFYLRIRKLFW